MPTDDLHAEALVREIEFENDEAAIRPETPEQRFVRVRRWVVACLKEKP